MGPLTGPLYGESFVVGPQGGEGFAGEQEVEDLLLDDLLGLKDVEDVLR